MENKEISISPFGNLRGGYCGIQFIDGNGSGLISLVEHPDRGEVSAVESYFRSLTRTCLHKVVQLDPEAIDARNLQPELRFSESEIAELLLSAPPMLGGEYLTHDVLNAFITDVYRVVSVRARRNGESPLEIVRELLPGGRNLGKVSFHLAENKGAQSDAYPFAFLASFIYAVSASDKAKHVPLKKALQLYANNPAKLKATLGPIEEAAKDSEFLRELLTSRRIFMPALWSSRDAFKFLRDIPQFEKAGIVVRVVNLWKGAPPKAKVSVSVGKSKGTLTAQSLLDFDVSLTVNGKRLTPEEVREIFDNPGGIVRVRGEWVEADPEKLGDLMKRWQEAQRLARSEGVSMIKALRLLSGAPDGALPADDENVTVEAGAGLKEILRDLRDPSGIEVPPLADSLAHVLRPYQKDGVKFLWRASEIGLGVCLADDMGLGKTLQLLSLASLWKAAGVLDAAPALFVLPATLLANWRDECAKWTPWLKSVILHPSSFDQKGFRALKADPLKALERYDLVFTTYGMVTRLGELREIEFPAVVADEAQAIKNAGTKQSLSVRAVKAARRIALTGTPVENRLTDLWSIFDFINPGLLGSLNAFQKDYGKPSDDAERNKSLYGRLRKLTRPFVLRRCKTDKSVVPDLPDKTEVKVHCALSTRQMALYRDIVENLRKALEDESVNNEGGGGNGIKRKGLVLAALMQFKQVCNHPSQYAGADEWNADESGKFERLREIAEQVRSRQEKMLVFTQFREMTNPLHDFLAECFGRPGLILHGGTSVKDRAARVKAFQSEDGAPFFVLSLKAAGVGLNLTAANHVVHFDRWWNPAVENQASDRAYRIGQKRNVLVHKFLCDGTIEEKIDSLIEEKKELAESIFSAGTEKLLTDMSDKELLDFVKLNE